jgi:transcriptional regulator of arginine metabolism
MSRTQRHALLMEILRDRPGSTQESLVAALAESGVEVTQATVSRDLAAIGAVRGPGGYLLPERPAVVQAGGASADRLARALREHAVSFEPAATLVVVRTAPGHAQLLASELDHARPPGMVGCIAGDDTIFVATPAEREARRLLARMAEAAGLSSTEPPPRGKSLNGASA